MMPVSQPGWDTAKFRGKWFNSKQPQDSHLAASVHWGPFLCPIPSCPQSRAGLNLPLQVGLYAVDV